MTACPLGRKLQPRRLESLNMPESVTIVIVPRDRFGSVIQCVEAIVQNTPLPYRIAVLDFGYSKKTLKSLRSLADGIPMDIVSCGRTIPMIAFRDYLPKITTQYVAWVDNDTFVTSGWMATFLARAGREQR